MLISDWGGFKKRAELAWSESPVEPFARIGLTGYKSRSNFL